jgi:hypothetical protein
MPKFRHNSVIMLSVIMLIVIILSVIMLSVIMLSVIMLSVVAPFASLDVAIRILCHPRSQGKPGFASSIS